MMIILKISAVFFLALVVGAEKKIELHDIEEDNLKSEKEKEYESSDHISQGGAESERNLVPLEFLKNGFLRYFDSTPAPQHRYVQQYAVTEQPERQPVISPKVVYDSPATQTQQAMVGYLSNVPMQIYLVPQYYNNGQEHASSSHQGLQYSTPTAKHVASYQNSPEPVQTQNNFIEIPSYVTPTAKTYVPHYSSQVALVSYQQPTVAPPQPTVAPAVTYQLPLVQYQNAVVQSPSVSPSKEYYQNVQYTETNAVDEVHEHDDDSPTIHTEVTYETPPQQYHRYHPLHTQQREEHRHSTVSELPHPNPLLLKSPPPHLSHLPKVLPMYRPIKPVYTTGGTSSGYTQRPPEPYGPPYKRRPTSLLDSYIPSHVQVEYMKRGFAKDPIEAFEALSSGRHLLHPPAPRHYERGFLPNQMYHTPGGGITYAHYKRTPKADKAHH